MSRCKSKFFQFSIYCSSCYFTVQHNFKYSPVQCNCSALLHFPCGVHVSAILVYLVLSVLNKCPIYFHLLLLYWLHSCSFSNCFISYFRPKHLQVVEYHIYFPNICSLLQNIHGARLDLIMGLLLDPQNEDVISILSRLFPGKSVMDVVNSRAADTAKIALRDILTGPVKSEAMSSKSRVTHDALSDR